MGNSDEFAPRWKMNETAASNNAARSNKISAGRYEGRSNHSIDKMSINSGLSSHDGSQVSRSSATTFITQKLVKY